MKNNVLVVMFGLAWACQVGAQDEPDSEFTTMILAQKNAIRYRPAPGKFLRSAEGIRELEITAEQTSKIEKTITESAKVTDELEDLIKQPQPIEAYKALSDRHTEATYKLRSDILAIVTPAQRKRFAQVAFQRHLSSTRSLQMYLHPSIQKFILLNQSQQADLYEAVNGTNAEYLKAFAELNEKYRQQVLDGVDPSIRDKVDPVVGEPWFRFQSESNGKSVLSKDVENKK